MKKYKQCTVDPKGKGSQQMFPGSKTWNISHGAGSPI